ncbi:hypothetical protein [Micromonospora sp. NBC_00858]|uniref:hypothetical protein n=1 Tax=Micromonospora sp. NBC_00858 TaxID=2975979 RepID=UPI00386F9C6F|nr:hypothetical protein OG990_26250 [Micromonospora sp. NBC_00858]
MTRPSVAVRAPDTSLIPAPYAGPGRVWQWMSIAAALIAAAGNIVGLTGLGDVYGRETDAFVNQALAQDIISLAVVSPAIIVLALLASRGSMAAYLAWLGTMAFTVYNYVIYTLSLHAGALFLPWIAVLGLSLFAVIGGLAALDRHAVQADFVRAPRRTAGWFLIIVAVAFAGLWLTDIIPALLAGQVPSGALELGLPSNPVHVLDLAFYLPATCAAGIGLLRHQAYGYATAPGLLIFLTLTGLPIMLTPLIASARGGTPAWAVLPPVAAVTIASLALAVRLLSSMVPTPDPVPTNATSP